MKMIEFVSSNVVAAGYEPDSRELCVQFKDKVTGGPGKTYRYYNVPSGHWNGILAAESVGRYISAHIVNGGYRYEVQS